MKNLVYQRNEMLHLMHFFYLKNSFLCEKNKKVALYATNFTNFSVNFYKKSEKK